MQTKSVVHAAACGYSVKSLLLVSCFVCFSTPVLAADNVSALGRLEPENGVILVSPALTPESMSGAVVAELLVGIGDDVESGQLLAVMETAALAQAHLAESEASLELKRKQADSVRSSAEEACVRARVAKSESERRVELLRKGVAGEEEAEAAAGLAEALASACTSARTAVYAAEAEINVAAANVELRKTQLDRSRVHSPIAGRILAIHAWPGEMAASEGLLEMGRVDHMYAIAEIYETDVARVKVGQKATVRSDALPQVLTGTVERIRPKVAKMDEIGTDPTARKDARIIEVEVRLDDSGSTSSLTYLQVDVEIQP